MICIKETGNCSSLCNSDRMFPMGMYRFWILCLFMPLLVGLGAAEPQGAAGSARWGHSAHGSAFDSGPRQKPWAMEGIGKAPFPITTRDPEVQKWFDQGNAMLHSFFFVSTNCSSLETTILDRIEAGFVPSIERRTARHK